MEENFAMFQAHKEGAPPLLSPAQPPDHQQPALKIPQVKLSVTPKNQFTDEENVRDAINRRGIARNQNGRISRSGVVDATLRHFCVRCRCVPSFEVAAA